MTAWALSQPVNDIRDLREIHTLCAMCGALNQNDISGALDICLQRVAAILKQSGGKAAWDKAECLELIGPSKAGLVPAGMLSIGA